MLAAEPSHLAFDALEIKNMRQAHPFVFLIAISLNYALPSLADEQENQRRTPTIIVLDKSIHCFGGSETLTEYILEGDQYVGTTFRFPKSYIDGLRDLLLASHENPDRLLVQLAFTEETAKLHRETIYAAAREWDPDNLPEEMPAWVEPLLEYDNIRKIAFDSIAGPPPVSTSYAEVRLELPGNPPITVRSTADRVWMLPWTITAGDQTWDTYSLQVSKALSVLADPTGPNAPYLDGTRYWSHDIWRDENLWSNEVGDEAIAIYYKDACESISGFESAAGRFRVQRGEIGSRYFPACALECAIRATTPMVIDAAAWCNPCANGSRYRRWETNA